MEPIAVMDRVVTRRRAAFDEQRTDRARRKLDAFLAIGKHLKAPVDDAEAADETLDARVEIGRRGDEVDHRDNHPACEIAGLVPAQPVGDDPNAPASS